MKKIITVLCLGLAANTFAEPTLYHQPEFATNAKPKAEKSNSLSEPSDNEAHEPLQAAPTVSSVDVIETEASKTAKPNQYKAEEAEQTSSEAATESGPKIDMYIYEEEPVKEEPATQEEPKLTITEPEKIEAAPIQDKNDLAENYLIKAVELKEHFDTKSKSELMKHLWTLTTPANAAAKDSSDPVRRTLMIKLPDSKILFVVDAKYTYHSSKEIYLFNNSNKVKYLSCVNTQKTSFSITSGPCHYAIQKHLGVTVTEAVLRSQVQSDLK